MNGRQGTGGDGDDQADCATTEDEMPTLSLILNFLSWPPEDQLRCFPDLAADSGSPNFSFDRDNPIVKLSRIIDDLNFRREGESLDEWRDRLGITRNLESEQSKRIAEILEGLHVVFDLARGASADYLFAMHGIKGSAAWRHIRSQATDGKRILGRSDDLSPDAVRKFIEGYTFEE